MASPDLGTPRRLTSFDILAGIVFSLYGLGINRAQLTVLMILACTYTGLACSLFFDDQSIYGLRTSTPSQSLDHMNHGDGEGMGRVRVHWTYGTSTAPSQSYLDIAKDHFILNL